MALPLITQPSSTQFFSLSKHFHHSNVVLKVICHCHEGVLPSNLPLAAPHGAHQSILLSLIAIMFHSNYLPAIHKQVFSCFGNSQKQGSTCPACADRLLFTSYTLGKTQKELSLSEWKHLSLFYGLQEQLTLKNLTQNTCLNSKWLPHSLHVSHHKVRMTGGLGHKTTIQINILPQKITGNKCSLIIMYWVNANLEMVSNVNH